MIGENGLVLTIGYLITEADEVWLTTQRRPSRSRRIALAYDQETGFGLVQALAQLDLPALEFGSVGGGQARRSRGLRRRRAASRSRPRSSPSRSSPATGSICSTRRSSPRPAHPSWGGAALVDAEGKLIGIGSLLLQMARGGEVADINMVVPIDLLPPILDDLLTHGRVDKPPRPWLGVFSAESNGDVVVMNVAQGGPAAQAGLQRGDIISDVRDAEVEVSPISTASSGAPGTPAPKCRCASCATAATPGCA